MSLKVLTVSILFLVAPLMGQQPRPTAPVPGTTVEVVGYKTLAAAAIYQSPVLADGASAIEALSIDVGNLHLEFSKGVACPVLVGGNVRGLYLQGTGQFRYLAK